MGKDIIIRSMLSGKVDMTPKGFVADLLTPEQFAACHEWFFDHILEIHASDITEVEGYGPFNEEGQPEYSTCREALIDNFSADKEGYWYNWKELFETTVLDRAFFEHYWVEMQDRIPYCEGKRYLVYNNMFFANMITDGQGKVGFPDWSRAGIGDFLLDFAIMDVNKPYLLIPERLFAYCQRKSIEVPDFKERYLCMAYYKGLDVLRWHASIDDIESCTSIMKSIGQLRDRIYAL